MEKIWVKAAENQKELEQCLLLRRKIFTEEKGISAEIEVDEEDHLQSKCEHFLVFLGENPVGACRCRYIGTNKVKIQRFCVLQDYRRRAVGKNFIKALESYYQKRGVLWIEIDSKYGVSIFYQKCGYQIRSKVFIEAGVQHVKMEKEIR